MKYEFLETSVANLAAKAKALVEQQVAQEIGVTRQGVQVIERRALAKLRNGLIQRGYSAEVMRDVLRELDGNRW